MHPRTPPGAGQEAPQQTRRSSTPSQLTNRPSVHSIPHRTSGACARASPTSSAHGLISDAPARAVLGPRGCGLQQGQRQRRGLCASSSDWQVRLVALRRSSGSPSFWACRPKRARPRTATLLAHRRAPVAHHHDAKLQCGAQQQVAGAFGAAAGAARPWNRSLHALGSFCDTHGDTPLAR